MTEIPKFETICDLFEQKPNAWEKARPYLHLALMMHIIWQLGLVIYDAAAVLMLPAQAYGRAMVLSCSLAALAAVVGTVLGYRFLRRIAAQSGMTRFSFYSFGMALFAFVLYLMV